MACGQAGPGSAGPGRGGSGLLPSLPQQLPGVGAWAGGRWAGRSAFPRSLPKCLGALNLTYPRPSSHPLEPMWGRASRIRAQVLHGNAGADEGAGAAIFKAKSCISGETFLGTWKGGQALPGPHRRSGKEIPSTLPGGHLHAPEGASELPWGSRAGRLHLRSTGRVKVRSQSEPSPP